MSILHISRSSSFSPWGSHKAKESLGSSAPAHPSYLPAPVPCQSCPGARGLTPSVSCAASGEAGGDRGRRAGILTHVPGRHGSGSGSW